MYRCKRPLLKMGSSTGSMYLFMSMTCYVSLNTQKRSLIPLKVSIASRRMLQEINMVHWNGIYEPTSEKPPWKMRRIDVTCRWMIT